MIFLISYSLVKYWGCRGGKGGLSPVGWDEITRVRWRPVRNASLKSVKDRLLSSPRRWALQATQRQAEQRKPHDFARNIRHHRPPLFPVGKYYNHDPLSLFAPLTLLVAYIGYDFFVWDKFVISMYTYIGTKIFLWKQCMFVIFFFRFSILSVY